ncbi:MAG: hypothetical protein ACR2PL_26115 [Dehalococcoidia bacterium]
MARACLGDDARRGLPPPTPETAALVATTMTYDDARRAQLAYQRFRQRGLQLGRGLAESACRRLIGQGVKGPGMDWTVAGAQAMATRRATYLRHRWTEGVAVARAMVPRRRAACSRPNRFTCTLQPGAVCGASASRITIPREPLVFRPETVALSVPI